MRHICRSAGTFAVSAYRLLMEDVNIWILMSGCMDFSGTQFLCLVLTFYISLQIALNDFVISEVQLNLKPSNSRTHIEPNQSELKTENRRTELCTCEELEPNHTVTFVRTWTEQNPSSEGSFPCLVLNLQTVMLVSVAGRSSSRRAWTALDEASSLNVNRASATHVVPTLSRCETETRTRRSQSLTTTRSLSFHFYVSFALLMLMWRDNWLHTGTWLWLFSDKGTQHMRHSTYDELQLSLSLYFVNSVTRI